MEGQENVKMVTLVLRDVINLMLQRRYFFGDGSSEIEEIMEIVSGERDVLERYGPEMMENIGTYVLGKLPDFPSMEPLLEKLAHAVCDIDEKTRNREPCDEDWDRLGKALASLETRFGKKFLIPQATIVLRTDDENRSPTSPPVSDSGETFRDSDRGSDRRPPLGGMETVPA
ncbi:MAG TPA: hypothetical protein VN420_01820 [Candidatus Fimivivens sp.]|nr:hypothetical protein [Candidatus Fimivivens sp.]